MTSADLPIDPALLSELEEEHKVSNVRALRALFATQNAGVEEALAWIEEHKNDPDIDVPVKITKSGEMKEVPQGKYVTDSERTENPELLKSQIDQELLGQLKEMGFAEIRAEKALYMTLGSNLEAAMEWIQQHQDDMDLDTPLHEDCVLPPKPKISKEEAQARAYELQEKLRKQRVEREKKEALEKEKNRIAMTKAMQEQQRQLEEAERGRAIEQRKREKEEHEKEKLRQRELMKREWEERFSRPYPENEEELASAEAKPKSGKEMIIQAINKLKKLYKTDNPAGLKTCVSTLKIYCDNAWKNPTEAKFHKIKKENNAFKTRVLPFDGSLELLSAVGFKDDGAEFLSIQGVPDGFLLGQAVKFLDILAGQL
mmetsp:Transcript_11506/g.22174  ORF Transcript_11506/g.22174 Transcript_11506/m.22174 type:complete len:371 (+) Transcript_11506:177-1289(+)